MLSLSDAAVQLSKEQATKLWRAASKTITMFSLPLSFIGARVCYHDGDPLNLLEELQRPGKAYKLLRNCLQAGHHSIFAHTPVLVPKRSVFPYYAGQGFKVWHLTNHFCLNLRHFTEAVPELVHDELLATFQRETLSIPVFHEVATGELSDLGIRLFVHQLPLEPDNDVWWWSILIDGLSRCCSHQIVRHTTLNFNQRSNRYTRVQTVLVPPSLRDRDDVQMYLDQAEEWYETLVESGVPKEDARYLYPHGARTVLLMSGPNFLVWDFVTKRAHPKAQWEIRAIAEALLTLFTTDEGNE